MLSTGVCGGVSTVDVPENRRGGTCGEDFQPDFFDGPLRERVRVCGLGVISPLAKSVALSSVESKVGNWNARPIVDFEPMSSSPSPPVLSVSESLSLIGGDMFRLFSRPFECPGLEEGRFGYRSKYLEVAESGDVYEEGVIDGYFESEAIVLSLNDMNGDFLRVRWVSKELESGWDTRDSITERETQRAWSIKSAKLE